jgi:fructokinase
VKHDAGGTITVAGEALMDMLVSGSGAVTAHPGGAPFNVARTVARLGGRCQFLGRMGDDAFGRRLRGALEERQVKLAVPSGTEEPTTLAVAELDEAGAADYRFYLEATAAAQLTPADVPAGVFDDTSAIALGGLGLLVEPMASTLMNLIRTAPPAATVLLDPNCRPRAIRDLGGYRASVDAFLARADLVKVSVEDLRLLHPDLDVRTAARLFLDRPPAAVLVTAGPDPVTIHTARAERSVPVPEVEVVDTVGAGDGFVAGLLSWWVGHGCERAQAADIDTLVQATRAAVTVSAAACTVAGADLPDEFVWSAA